MGVNKGTKSASVDMKEKQNQTSEQAGHDYFSNAGGQHQQQHGQQQQSYEGFSDLDSVFGTPVSMSGVGDVVVGYREAFETAMREDLGIGKLYGKVYQAHGLSRTANRLPADMILLTRTDGRDVYFYGMLLAASHKNDTVRQEQLNGRAFTCYQTPAELFDQHALEEVKKYLANSYGDATLWEVGFNVVPANVKYDNANGVSKLMANGINAISGYINRMSGKSTLTAQRIAGWGGIGTKMEFSKEGVTGINSQPNRTDLNISLSVNEGRNQQQRGYGSAQYTSQQRELIRSSGYVDLVRNPPQNSPVNVLAINPALNAAPHQAYTARMVVSNLEQVDAANSLELTLLALASCEMAAGQMAWGEAFVRQYGDSVANELHDIGGVGLELNLTGAEDYQFAKMNTKDASFNRQALLNTLGVICSPGLILSMDIEEGGSQMWLHRLFSKVANADAESGQAAAEIIKAANNLTNGLFSQNFQAGQPLIKPDYVRAHLGRYEDKNGEIRDIRDIDYLAVLNTSQPGDLSAIVTWRESFDERFPGSETIRLAEREKIIRTLAQNVTFTGMARRITFAPQFIAALQQSLAQAGVALNANTTSGLGGNTNIYTDMTAYAMGVNPAQQNAFNYAAPQNQPQQGYTARNRFM